MRANSADPSIAAKYGGIRTDTVALGKIFSDPYDLIVLDNMLSKKDGITDLDELRGEGIATPVLMLTTKSDVTNPVKKLDLGTDDYLHKPFSLAELLALIRALLRRSHEQISSSLIIGNIRMDTQHPDCGKSATTTQTPAPLSWLHWRDAIHPTFRPLDQARQSFLEQRRSCKPDRPLLSSQFLHADVVKIPIRRDCHIGVNPLPFIVV